MNNQWDDYVSAADDKHRKAMEDCSRTLLERIRAAREGRDPDSNQFSLWGRF